MHSPNGSRAAFPAARRNAMRNAMRNVTHAVLLVGGVLIAACSDNAPPTAPVAASRATPAASDRQTAAERWMALTRQIVGRREPTPGGTARAFALVAVAQYDAIIAAQDAKTRGLHPSEAGAAVSAAARVLAALYPVESATIAGQIAADEAYFPTLPSERDADFGSGMTVGNGIAAAVLARAATDNSTAVWTGTVPVGAGYWYSAPPPALPVAPLWGTVRPWLLTSGSQFRPAPPPAFGSPEFLTALAEVRHDSDTRTAQQLAIAQFWAFGLGAGGPMGYFTDLATRFAMHEHMNEEQSARVFATMHMAMMDASIGCWDAKYAYWYIRPFQADPAIATPVGRPNFPSYPSAHSCFSAAAVGVLAGIFPAQADSLNAMVVEAGDARIFAGLHYRFDVLAGQQLGASVAALALEKMPHGHDQIPLD